MKKIRWCCRAFRSHFERAGEEGFWIVADRWHGGEPRFFLRHQSMDADMKVEWPEDAKITLVGELPIDYCPWCGKSLVKRYRGRIKEMVREDLTLDSIVKRSPESI